MPLKMKKSSRGLLLLIPLLTWLLLFLILPYLFIFVQAFLESDAFGKVVFHFTLASFIKLFITNLYYATIARTFLYAVIVACTCIFISIPLAYYIAFKTKRNKTLLYSLIVLPFWISYIVRAYAWKIILGENGILNSFLVQSGITDHPLSFLLYSNFSTLVCLVYILTPFTAIPIYTAFENIPKSLVEASKDLGAGSWTTFRKVIFPLALPGVISGGTFALVLTMGDFLSPLLLGGPNTIFISNIVQNLFGTSNDKPSVLH
jgi:spermidine/putrescine transport system permease protein